MPKFQNIPQFTRSPSYHVTQPWLYLEDWLARRPTLVDADFQRLHVWTEAQQIAYIEYILRGGKSGRAIYFNQADWMGAFKAPMYLVDGKQRTNAVLRFLHNEIPAFGTLLRDYEDSLNQLEAYFDIYVNDLKTYRDVVRWYIEMNTGGTPHTDEEIAKAVDLLEQAPKGKL